MPFKRKPRVLLRSSWQVLNIGDVAHSPGVLALLQKQLPDVETALWASENIDEPVKAMIRRRFPGLNIVTGKLDDYGKASTPGLGEAVAVADFLLHGSGPSLLAYDDVAAFAKHTGKPYGVFGITFGWYEGHDFGVYDRAQFLFFRDSVSLERAKAKLHCPIIQFGPDGAFSTDLRDDASATAFLKASGLVPGQFLCCIPRHRITPFWRPDMQNRPMTPADHDAAAENERWQEHDHAPLRAAIAAVVDHPEMKVLVCPESRDQTDLGKEAIMDKLPDRVRERVVWRDRFWHTDEALSVYVRSAGLFGLEMHSPIMCVGNGIPAIVCRWERQTSKGFMWRDIGLGDWLFDMEDEASIPGIVPAVNGLVENPERARQKVIAAQKVVQERQAEMIAVLRSAMERCVR